MRHEAFESRRITLGRRHEPLLDHRDALPHRELTQALPRTECISNQREATEYGDDEHDGEHDESHFRWLHEASSGVLAALDSRACAFVSGHADNPLKQSDLRCALIMVADGGLR